jgi:nucleoside-diphosphate-sugar epimerase
MKVLILGAAGYVGTILRPAFESEHETYYSDMTPVPGAESRTTVCDIEDVEKLKPAFAGMDSVIYLPYGRSSFAATHEVDLGFNVNVRAVYKNAKLAMDAGVPNFVYAASLSAFNDLFGKPPLTEDRPADAQQVYGITKWLGEQVCEILSRGRPEMTFVSLRLILPKQEKDFTADFRFNPAREKNMCGIGPNDTRRLFLAAAALRKPGYHMAHASGDLLGKTFPNARVKALLGWEPRNE